jgi:signal transduction histidine kinase
MDSSRARFALGAAGMAASCLAAGALWARDGTPLSFSFVACGWGAALCLQLMRNRAVPMVAAPAPAALPPPAGDSVEHVPVALFRVTGATSSALNAAARRLMAPGRVADGPALLARLAALVPQRRGMIEYDTERGRERALVAANELVVEGRKQRLVALLPMEDELEAAALDSWEQLVQVLSHEIMNSLTPVGSLARTLRRMLEGVPLPAELASDANTSLDAIARRADGLARFVSGYRALAAVPEAVPQEVRVGDLFARVAALTGARWSERGGQASFDAGPAGLTVRADPGQLEQALVNLIRNAEEACADVPKPQLRVQARIGRGGRLRIEVGDNGPGIADEVLPQVFKPFFSTKESGSGIGLALVRQLVHRNGGTVRYVKSVRPGASFVLSF